MRLLALSIALIATVASTATGASAAPATGQVVAWGSNYYGQSTPPATTAEGVTMVSAGLAHGLALKNGVPIHWGDSSEDKAFVPIDLRRGGVTAIAAGNHQSLAIKNGKVWSWGRYTRPGQVLAPPPETQSGITHVAAGYLHNLALDTEGKVIA